MEVEDQDDWREARWVAIDVETAGISPERDRVLEIAAVVRESGQDDSTWHVLLDPQVAVSPSVRSLVGAAAENVAGRPTFADVAEQFLDLLTGAVVISAAAAEFVWPFLAAELDRAGKEPPRPLLVGPLLLTREVTGNRYRRLAEACRAVGIPEPSFLAPVDDSRAVLALATEVAPRLPGTAAAIKRVQHRCRLEMADEGTLARKQRRPTREAKRASVDRNE